MFDDFRHKNPCRILTWRHSSALEPDLWTWLVSSETCISLDSNTGQHAWQPDYIVYCVCRGDCLPACWPAWLVSYLCLCLSMGLSFCLWTLSMSHAFRSNHVASPVVGGTRSHERQKHNRNRNTLVINLLSSILVFQLCLRSLLVTWNKNNNGENHTCC